MATFLFLELTDRVLNSLFFAIEEAIYGHLPIKPVHLTIRGPYQGIVPPEVVNRCRLQMKNDVLRFEGVGRFSNDFEEVVYLKVQSPNLRKIWWKPDYPINKYGFNPHISIYRGNDSTLAEALRLFFEHESLCLDCAEFKLVSHVSRQLNLLKTEVSLSKIPFHELIGPDRIKENLLSRLSLVVLRQNRRNSVVDLHWQVRNHPKSG